MSMLDGPLGNDLDPVTAREDQPQLGTCDATGGSIPHSKTVDCKNWRPEDQPRPPELKGRRVHPDSCLRYPVETGAHPSQDALLDEMVRDFTSIGFHGSKSEVRRRLLDWRGSTPSPDPQILISALAAIDMAAEATDQADREGKDIAAMAVIRGILTRAKCALRDYRETVKGSVR